MAYPDSQLADDERVLQHQHPHWKKLLPPALILTPALLGCGYLAALATATPAQQVAWPALGVLATALALWFGLLPWMRWQCTHFVLTDNKVMFREGVLARTGMNIPLSRITSVRTQLDLNDRLFGCGTLIVESASDEPLEFDDIPAVEDVQMLLYRAADGHLDARPAL